jgi:hypothetical protein
MFFVFVQCGEVNTFVAKRNYFKLAMLANAKKCLPLTQRIWNIIYNEVQLSPFNRMLYDIIYWIITYSFKTLGL